MNVNLMTTCEFYEPVDIVGKALSFVNAPCPASGKLDGADLILSRMDDCDFCGMGASINGTFSRFAEIIFDYGDGKPAVKQVYKSS